MVSKKKLSAGILLYRLNNKKPEVLLAHPGGPYWAKKDLGSWSIPKGEFEKGEDPLANAIREFEEETGYQLKGKFKALTPLKQRSGKLIYAFTTEGDLDPGQLKSNLFEIEWPPRSGQMKQFPEIDRVGWFDMEEAMEKIIEGQKGFIDQLLKII